MQRGGGSSVGGNYTCTDSILDSLSLTSDGKVSAALTMLGNKQTLTGTYAVNGDKVTVTLPGSPPAEFPRSGNTLHAGVNAKCTKH
jgi:hypothetical protein